jgi:pilus assembly protein CpaB
MKLRPVFFGLLIAGVGVALLALYMHRFEQEVSGGSRISLLVAVSPIERGKPITADMLGTRSVPQAYVDDREIRASEKERVLSLHAVNNVPVLQTLAWSDVIAASDDQRDLSTLVQPGNRGMPIFVQNEDILQLIRPGDFVDVLSVVGDAQEASVLVQRVLVLAAGVETSTDRSQDSKKARPRMLTLSVSLEEAQLLALAQSSGHLSIVVRNPNDQRVNENVPDVSRSALFDPVARSAVQTSRHRGPVKIVAETGK